jgi:hypothetical protein
MTTTPPWMTISSTRANSFFASVAVTEEVSTVSPRRLRNAITALSREIVDAFTGWPS